MNLTDEQQRRYARTLMLDNITETEQIKLLNASVLIVGCGALGSIASMYLAASGVGHITVVDFDTVGLSNLQRQLSFTEHDLGQKKSDTLARKLRDINSEIEITAVDKMLRQNEAIEIFKNFDVIVEASDNPSTKYMVTDTAQRVGKPCVVGGVRGFDGQVTTVMPGEVAYRDIFPDTACSGFTPCSAGGVLGPLPGVVASIQAAEVIKTITGVGKTLKSRMLIIDLLNGNFRTISFS